MAAIETRPLPAMTAGAGGRAPARISRRTATGVISVVLFLVVWQVVGSTNLISADEISYPTAVAAAAARMTISGELASNAWISLAEFVEGFLPSLLVGVLVGVAMGLSRRVRYLLEPLVMALYTAPRIALLPLLVIWFGIGMESKIAVVFLGAVFQILVNTATGVEQVDPIWIRAARSYGANTLQVIAKVIVPGALPSIMTGIRLGIGRAIIGVVVGEMYVAVAGLGHLVQVYSSAARPADLLVLVLVFAMFGVVTVNAVRWLEERAGAWRQPQEL